MQKASQALLCLQDETSRNAEYCRALQPLVVPLATGRMPGSSVALLPGEKREHKELPVWSYSGIAVRAKDDAFPMPDFFPF